jgi:hypothetical protein
MYLHVSALMLLAILFSFSPAAAQEDLGESYDENTELTVRGSVVEAKRETPGPFVIKLRTKNMIYNVVTAPPWYLTREQIVLREGLELEVTGSKYIGKDGNLFLLARQITDISTGKVIILRDTHCRPLWHGHRMQRGRNQQLP